MEHEYIPESIIKANNERIAKLRTYAYQNMPTLPYHNIVHVEEAIAAAKQFGYRENIPPHKMFLLCSALYLHDIVYNVGSDMNEEDSADIASDYCNHQDSGYNQEETSEIISLVLATKPHHLPQNKLEELIRDADLENLGRDVFFDKNELLRQEFGKKQNREWMHCSYNFLVKHHYHTKAAQELRNEGKERNVQLLYSMLQTYDISKEKNHGL